MLRRLVTVGARHPALAIAVAAFIALAGGAIALFGPLEVSTSRRNLLSSDDPGQRRLLAFLDRFGHTDAAVFVISGAPKAARQQVTAALLARLEAQPALAHRVLGRLDLRLVAEVMALHEPRMLDGLQVSGDAPVTLATLFRGLTTRILANLDGEARDEGDVRDMARLAPLVAALDAALRGEEVGEALSGLVHGESLATAAHLDDRGFLTTRDGEHHVIVSFPDLPSDEGRDIAPIVEGMRAVRDEVLAEADAPGITADLTGLPALSTDELAILGRGIKLTSLLSTVGILLILILAFRSLRLSIIALVPLGAGVLGTLGAAELLFDGLNLVTSSFVSVLMGLGIDVGVHILFRYGEERRAGHPHQAAVERALLLTAPGVSVGTLVTALAFLTLLTTSFTAFAELGVITAIGLALMLVLAFLLIPPLLRLLGERFLAGVAVPELPGSGPALGVVARHPRAVLVVTAALLVAAVVASLPRGPGFNGNYFDFLPDDTESYRGLVAVSGDPAMGPAVVHVTAPDIEVARAQTARLRALPEVAGVDSPTDLLPPLDGGRLEALQAVTKGLDAAALARVVPPAEPTTPEALGAAALALGDAFDELAYALEQGGRDVGPVKAVQAALTGLRATLAGLDAPGRARLAEIERDTLEVAGRAARTAKRVAERGRYAPADLPPFFRARYVSKDGELLALHAYPSGDIWDVAVARRFADAVLAVAPDACGLGLDILHHRELIVDGFVRAASYAAALVVLVLLLTFRRLSDAGLALTPVLIGWLAMLGAMKPLGLSFDMANLVSLPLVLGIGLAGGVHMVQRARQSLAEHGEVARLADLVKGTGAAVIISFVTTMAGFFALMFGGYGAMVSLGALLVLGIGLCLLASVVVLPALMVLVGRAR